MADTGQAWNEVGKSFEALGLKLKMHLEQGVDESNRESFQTALKNFGTVVEQGVAAMGNAVRDPAVQADLDRVAASIREALASTVDQAGDAIRGGNPPE
jgi:hypothetical protein